jgi:predicted Zn-dependent protease
MSIRRHQSEGSVIQRSTSVNRRQKILAVLGVVTLLIACSTSPTGRKQFMMYDDSSIAPQAVKQYEQMKKQKPPVTDPKVNNYVNCIANALLATLPGDAGRGWEINVFDDKDPNAFALPGKKIGVHTGIFKVATNQDQLATVIGHEIGHVEAHHGAERMSMGTATNIGVMVAAVAIGASSDNNNTQLAAAALGLGATYGLMMPFSRAHESEADKMGLEYMARAGFNPEASIELWKNMAKQSKGQPAEFLSTHPSHDTRTQKLSANMGQALMEYDAARAAGKKPDCRM